MAILATWKASLEQFNTHGMDFWRKSEGSSLAPRQVDLNFISKLSFKVSHYIQNTVNVLLKILLDRVLPHPSISKFLLYAFVGPKIVLKPVFSINWLFIYYWRVKNMLKIANYNENIRSPEENLRILVWFWFITNFSCPLLDLALIKICNKTWNRSVMNKKCLGTVIVGKF